jgi:hypothetical protein
MIRLIAMSIAALVSGPLAAQAYKWVDERGVTNYGEKPPANRPSRAVDTQPGGTLESGSLQQKKFEADLRGSVSATPAPAPAVAAAEVPARGMGFDTYIRLQRGMSEGELILRAGKPDHESVENFRHDIVKSYYYYPTLSDPFITVVTVRGGRIANIERTRKAY